MIYIAEPDGGNLCSSARRRSDQPASSVSRSGIALSDAARGRSPRCSPTRPRASFEDLEARFGDDFPSGAWDTSPQQAA